MLLNFLWLLSVHFSFVLTYDAIPLSEAIYPEKCKMKSHVVNDCNWCYCGGGGQFMCRARMCNNVDVFQHFKENIQELHLGMEGHGSWRSSIEQSCEPMVQYSKGNVSCICTKAGTWPNVICDKLFHILFSVQVTGVAHPTPKMYCNHTQLYLIGCNVCFCPKPGYIDSELCTNKTCRNDDPALAANSGGSLGRRSFTTPFKSIYATCITNQQYKIGCRKCICKENNILVCDDCKNETKLKKSSHICYGNRKYTFIDNCNICYCGKANLAICTTKKCYNAEEAQVLERSIGLPGEKISIDFDKAPEHDKDCIPGTKFLKHCSICNCMDVQGIKIIDCQADTCNKNTELEDVMSSYCIPGTFYELDCLYCRCFRYRGIIWQRCAVNKTCTSSNVSSALTADVEGSEVSLTYRAPNGASSENSDTEEISLDVIRVFDNDSYKCTPDSIYKLACNYCFCLDNGNSLCTFFTCK